MKQGDSHCRASSPHHEECYKKCFLRQLLVPSVIIEGASSRQNSWLHRGNAKLFLGSEPLYYDEPAKMWTKIDGRVVEVRFLLSRKMLTRQSIFWHVGHGHQ